MFIKCSIKLQNKIYIEFPILNVLCDWKSLKISRVDRP